MSCGAPEPVAVGRGTVQAGVLDEEVVMGQSTSVPDRVARELAAATGRSPAEMKVVVAVGAVVGATVLLVRLITFVTRKELHHGSRPQRY